MPQEIEQITIEYCGRNKRVERALNLLAAAMESVEDANQAAAKALDYSEQLSSALMRFTVEDES